ncbi:hypothetical protein Q6248_27935, partial [Klebsiella pneumoniae]|uniref:hypothetical protein n=1 Tax=Klebsiella pneumoniae TaxID=573 RepID=UPI0027314DBA
SPSAAAKICSFVIPIFRCNLRVVCRYILQPTTDYEEALRRKTNGRLMYGGGYEPCHFQKTTAPVD